MKIKTLLIIKIVFSTLALLIIPALVITIRQHVEQLNKQEVLIRNIEHKAGELSYLASDYILYREGQQIQRWNSKYSSVAVDVSSLTVDNPDQQALIDNIKANHQQLKNIFDDLVLSIGSAPQTQRNTVDLELIKVSRNRIGVIIQGIVVDTSRLSQQIQGESNQLKQVSTLLMLILTAAFIAFLLFDYLLIYRRTLKSLSNLRDGTIIIGSGNLEFIINTQKDDEIGELAHAINQMTMNLRTVTASKSDQENEIAKRKLYERALRKSEERYRTVAKELREVDLRQSEERFYKVFYNSPDLMAIIKAEDDSYVEVNNAFLNAYGYTRDEIIGQTPIDMGIVTNDEAREKNLKLLIEQGEFKNIEYINHTKSGQIVNVLCSAASIDFNGEVCWLLILKDITEMKRYEQEIARLDRLNLVGEMSASISHEIRNPMTTVRGYLQLLRQKDINRPYLEQFDLMIEELDRANGIITEFLSLARGKLVEMEPMNLQSTINRLYPLITADSLLTDKRVELDLGQTADIYGDEKEIRQLILNLVRNGLEAMSAGGTLTIKTFQEESTVMLQVDDQGKGICQEVLNKLGTPFLTTKENGTGLGLAVCYSIALRHKARISVVTGSGGTTFRVGFPESVSGAPVVQIAGGRSAERVYTQVPGADIEYFI